MDVQTVLAIKGTDVATIRPGASVQMAAQILRAKGIGALVVSDDDRSVEGVLTERDIVVGLAEKLDRLMFAKVSEVMTKHVVTCKGSDAIDVVLAQMTRHRRRQIVVLDDEGHLAGIVSIGDLVKHRLDEIELEVHVLRDVSIARS